MSANERQRVNGQRVRCEWPVTAVNPSGESGHDHCLEARCDRDAGHTEPHGGWFTAEELEPARGEAGGG